jgi:hypothetical protein
MTRRKYGVRLGVLALLGWLTAAGAAHAQVTTADVVGRVTDSSGGALPGATVTVTNPATGGVRTQVTSETGDYTFSLLPIGTHPLSVELQGLGAFTRTVRLSADRDERRRLGRRSHRVLQHAAAGAGTRRPNRGRHHRGR